MGKQLLAMLLGLSCLQAHAIDTSAPVTAVTLYPGSATITRSLQVAAGATRAIANNLPAGFDAQTIKVDADAGIQLGQVVIQENDNIEASNPNEAVLEGRIQALRDTQGGIEAELRAAEIVKAYLEKLGAPGDEKGVAPPQNINGAIDAIGRGAGTTLTKMHKLGIEQRELAKQIAVLEKELERIRSGNKNLRTVTIQMSANRAGNVRLSYQINNAGWKPAYRAMLHSAESTLDLERMGVVSQKTGEDWKDVKLVLSTNQPRLTPTAPEPYPWQLSYVSPDAPAQAGRAAAAMAAPREAAKGAYENAYQPPTFETQNTFSTEFEVPGRVSVAADGREVSLPLAKQSVVVTQKLRAIPRRERAAFVTAEAERPSGVWPSGNMQLFRDGDYVGANYWRPENTDKFVFSFGRDDLVQISLKPVKGQSGTTGVFDKRNEKRFSDLITLTSNHKKPVDILVLESSPVSLSDEVKVKSQFSPSPSSENWQDVRGVVAWEKTLAPRESLKINVDYVVEYPKQGYVSGLR